jgi:hypothetical protein
MQMLHAGLFQAQQNQSSDEEIEGFEKVFTPANVQETDYRFHQHQDHSSQHSSQQSNSDYSSIQQENSVGTESTISPEAECDTEEDLDEEYTCRDEDFDYANEEDDEGDKYREVMADDIGT